MLLPFVDVIIPHLNDRHRLAICLECLSRQSYPSDRFRVTVVDNGSSRPIDDVLAPFPFATLAVETERGCGSARNRGVAMTSGDILAFTDSDCRPHEDWLLNGVRRLTDGSGIDIVGGAITVFCADENRPTDAELFDVVFGFEQKRYVTRKNFAAGANIMVPRAVFERIGPFRNGLLPEDLEWGRRAVAMGLRIGYAPDVLIYHPARRSWEDVRKKAERTTWHARNYLSERPLFRLKWAALTAAMATPPLLKTLHLMRTSDIRGMGRRLRAIRMLFRFRYYRVWVMLGYLFAPAPPRPSTTPEPDTAAE